MDAMTAERIANEEHARRDRAIWEKYGGAILMGLMWSVLLITAVISCVFYVGYRLMT